MIYCSILGIDKHIIVLQNDMRNKTKYKISFYTIGTLLYSSDCPIQSIHFDHLLQFPHRNEQRSESLSIIDHIDSGTRFALNFIQ